MQELEEDLERVKEELAEMKKKFNDSRQREKEQAKIYRCYPYSTLPVSDDVRF